MPIILVPAQQFTAKGWFSHLAAAPGWFSPLLGDIASSGLSATVNRAVEIDVANVITWAPKRRLVTQTLETDLSQGLTVRRSYTVGQVLEIDLAQAIIVRRTYTIGQVTEFDAAQGITANPIRRLITQALETDLAQPITVTGAQVIPVGLVTEIDLAQVITWAPKARLVNQGLETDIAQPITVFVPSTGAPSIYRPTFRPRRRA